MCLKATIISRRRLKCFGKYVIVVAFLVAYVVLLMRESYSAWEESEQQQQQRNKDELLIASEDPKEPMKRRTNQMAYTKHRKNESLAHSAVKNAPNNNQILHRRRRLRPAILMERKATTLLTATTLTTPTAAAATVAAETINPIYEYSDELNSATMQEMAQRQRHLWTACADLDLIGRHTPNAWEFVVSPGHSLAWCNVFKAASSMWLYYFNILGGYDVTYLQRTKSSALEMTRKKFPRPTLDELDDALSTSVSFLVVREPLERLLSAYRDKLEGLHNKYYKTLGEQIMKQYRSARTKEAGKRRNGPTFLEFVLYLTENHRHGGRFDEHWAPIYTFCTPCSINFTVIAKTETFQRDSEFIIRKAGLETILFNKMPIKKSSHISNRSPSSTKSMVDKYFAQLDTATLDDLLAIYEPDFQLFGYDSSKYYTKVRRPARNETHASKAP